MLNEKTIAALEDAGFKRWQKGDYDRLYINAKELGLECDYYKTGNISSATFRGERISNSQGYRYKSAKTYIDVKTGKVRSDYPTLQRAAEQMLNEAEQECA